MSLSFLLAAKARKEVQGVVLGQIPDGTITDAKLSSDGIKSLIPNPSIFTGLAKDAGAVLYLDARMADRFNLPVNDPLTNPWTDLSGFRNDATPTNFAGTIASGVDTTDPSKPFWVLDGTDDFFGLINSSSLDITSAPMGVFATINVSPLSSTVGYIVCKNLDASTNVQYGMYWDNVSSRLSVFLEGAVKKSSLNNSLEAGAWYNVGFIWDATNVKLFINQVQSSTSAAFSGTLTTRANVQIGCRGNTGGSKTALLNGKIATVTVYSGSKATETNILKSERTISNAYIGG